jgi:hypothetical protein
MSLLMSLRLNLPSRVFLLILLIVLTSARTSYGADTELDQARALLADGRANDAYAMLESREFDRAGDVEFDTMLGIAALDSGKPDRATLAFERVLAVNPNAAGARLDLARAYFALGDLVRAQQELDVVAQNNPPPAAQAVIDKYRTAIADRVRAKSNIVTGYVEGFVGYDNNITAVVGDFGNAVLATYNLVGFLPTGNSILRASPITGTGGGIELTHQMNDAWSFVGGADARYRDVTNDNNYSSGQINLHGNVVYALGANVFRGGVALEEFKQRTDVPTDDRHSVGLNIEWRHIFSERDQSSVFAVATRQRYPDIAVDDVDSILFGAGWLHQFEGNHKPILYFNSSMRQDNAQNLLQNGSDNSRRYAGGRVYGQWSLNDDFDLFVNFGLLERSDRSMFARSSTIEFGDDHISDTTIGCNWRPKMNWTIRSQVTYTENRSNVALSDFRRTEANINARYDFK